ncbi:hypothetical protein BZA70DRAFT_271410 [Myxozyma melibiosi]|uniref:Armadillo-like helical domain-containing protein n=1 Tax=Myxozyma melibiosi TaxID=54550 RepID=A0ABR1FCB5_9ASCO
MAALVSPLVRVERGSLQPKIIGLYQALFKEGATPPENDGFWVEFFLLKANMSVLSVIISSLPPDSLLQSQATTKAIFTRAVRFLGDKNPNAVKNALDTLHILVREVLAKPLTSSDIITVLVGLDQVDREFMEFVARLELLMRRGATPELRSTALHTSLSIVCGAYRTSLINYFLHRDIFPALIQIMYDKHTTKYTFEAFVLLGVLSSYDRMQAYNPYQTRLSDFVDEAVMQKIVVAIGKSCRNAREEYLAVADDSVDQFSFESLLSYTEIARRAKNAFSQQDQESKISKEFAALPPLSATVLLATSNFVHANKFFARVLCETKQMSEETPCGSLISLSSYLLQHQHRSERTAIYARLLMLINRILVEDPSTMGRLVAPECRSSIRICRQRQPVLPRVQGDRLLVEGILDSLIGAIRHNMKRTLDVPMYSLAMGTILRIISQLKRLRVRLTYHWSELWKSIFSFLRFMVSSASHVQSLDGVSELVDDTIRILVLAFSAGESFLSGAADYDDLFYKLVETGDLLTRLSTTYKLPTTHSIGTLVSISEHYRNLIKEKSTMFSSSHLSSEQVSEVIKNGYDTLSISAQQGIDVWDRYRESDERVFLKKAGMTAVHDARELLARQMMPVDMSGNNSSSSSLNGGDATSRDSSTSSSSSNMSNGTSRRGSNGYASGTTSPVSIRSRTNSAGSSVELNGLGRNGHQMAVYANGK